MDWGQSLSAWSVQARREWRSSPSAPTRSPFHAEGRPFEGDGAGMLELDAVDAARLEVEGLLVAAVAVTHGQREAAGLVDDQRERIGIPGHLPGRRPRQGRDRRVVDGGLDGCVRRKLGGVVLAGEVQHPIAAAGRVQRERVGPGGSEYAFGPVEAIVDLPTDRLAAGRDQGERESAERESEGGNVTGHEVSKPGRNTPPLWGLSPRPLLRRWHGGHGKRPGKQRRLGA